MVRVLERNHKCQGCGEDLPEIDMDPKDKRFCRFCSIHDHLDAIDALVQDRNCTFPKSWKDEIVAAVEKLRRVM